MLINDFTRHKHTHMATNSTRNGGNKAAGKPEEPKRASAPGGCSHRDDPHAAGAARPPDVCEPLAEVETECVDRYASVH